MKLWFVLAVCILIAARIILPDIGVAQESGGSGRFGSSSMGSLDRFDMTSPAQLAELMASRHATLQADGVVDPDTYILGPGDLLGLEIIGALTMSGEDVVGADGTVTFNQLGSFAVGGLTLSQARRLVTGRSEGVLRDGAPQILLKSMRTFKVRLVGRVMLPGAQSASPSTRVSEMIFLAEGFMQHADFRNIQVIHRDGSTTKADLLPFLLAGRLETNPKLQDGDVVLVPVKTEEIELLGAVLHPGKYNFVEGDELGEMLGLVGLHPRADIGWALVQRYSDGVHWDTLSVDLRSVLQGVSQVPLKAGDRVLIRATGEWHTGAVAHVRGAVRYPGPVPVVRSGVTVRDAINLAGGFMDDATEQRVILGRPFTPDTTRTVDPNPGDQLVQGLTRQRLHEVVVDLSGGARGPVVDPGDFITVPRHEGWIQVMGQVKLPGFYDFHDGWEIRDYIKAGGGFAKYADEGKIQVSRGRYGDVAYDDDVGPLAPGDIIWIPEKEPFKFWPFFRDALAVTAQAAALIIIVRDATR